MSSTTFVFVAAVCVAACTVPGAQNAPPDELAGFTPGVDDQAGFLLESAFRPGTPIAAGGAVAQMEVIVRQDAPSVATVASSDPTVIAAVAAPAAGMRNFTLKLKSGVPGTANLILSDASGGEIDRVALDVQASDQLAPDGAVSNLTVLANAVQTFHVTTVGGGTTLLGDGAVSFQHDATIALVDPATAPYWATFGGDELLFRASTPGPTTIVASAPDATVTAALTVIDASAIDGVRANPATVTFTSGTQGNTVEIDVTAGPSEVYGAVCDWTVPSALTVSLQWFGIPQLGEPTAGGFLGLGASFVYTLSGAPGSYQAICTVPGGMQTTVAVTIN